ncbi:hypothetical protein SBP8a_251 [Bacillus phage SBP8a]|nr:hypothetical protein SBP8a_251 [Bacillus phage SBP8a]
MRQQQLEQQIEELELKIKRYEDVLKNIARRDRRLMSESSIRQFSGWGVMTRNNYNEVILMAGDVLRRNGVKVRKGDE